MTSQERALRRRRWELLARAHRALDPVFLALSGVWIVLVVYELVAGSLPRSLEVLVWAIWAAFIVEFGVGLIIAPSRITYARKRWLTAVSLVLPALRFIRVLSLVRILAVSRVTRSFGLLRVLTTVNRALGALGRTGKRRGLGYVVGATGLVLVIGAAGMAYLEPPGTLLGAADPEGQSALRAFADALWWTAYTMTTGAPSIPATGEGRLVGWLLSLYGLAVFGYLTAVLASHFIGRDISTDTGRNLPLGNGRPGAR